VSPGRAHLRPNALYFCKTLILATDDLVNHIHLALSIRCQTYVISRKLFVVCDSR
jgi:hypothetical protein